MQVQTIRTLLKAVENFILIFALWYLISSLWVLDFSTVGKLLLKALIFAVAVMLCWGIDLLVRRRSAQRQSEQPE